MDLIELAAQLRGKSPTYEKAKPAPKPKEWYKSDSDCYALKRRTAKLLDLGIIDKDEKCKIDEIGRRIAWGSLDIKNTLKGYFDQLNADPDCYINTDSRTVNGLLAAAIRPGKNTATETAYKTALSIIAQINIRALKTLHVYSLKATELDRLAEALPDDCNMILLTNAKGDLRLQDLYSLTLDQDYKIMPTWTWRHDLEDGSHERAISVCREEIIDRKTVEYSYRQYRLAEINKANGQAAITRPTRLKTQQDNPRYKHCYYLN